MSTAPISVCVGFHGRAHLHDRPRGCDVLVIGATNGIGSFAVQLAALAGSRVAAVGSAQKLPALAEYGLHESILRASFSGYGRQKRDVILHTHGGMSATDDRRVVRPGGVVVTTRPISGPTVVDRIVPAPLARKESLYTSVMTSARSQDLTRSAALVDQGRLRPMVDSTFDRSRL